MMTTKKNNWAIGPFGDGCIALYVDGAYLPYRYYIRIYESEFARWYKWSKGDKDPSYGTWVKT